MLFSGHFAQGKNQPALPHFDSISEKVDRYGLQDASKAWLLIDSSLANGQAGNGFRADIYRVYWETLVHYNQGKNDSSMIARIGRLQNRLNKSQLPFEKALLDHSLSLTYYLNGDYAKSFMEALYVAEQAKQLHNNKLLYMSLALLGTVCSHIGNYSMAEDYYKQALPLADNPLKENRIKMNRCNVWYLSGKVDRAIDSLTDMIPGLVAQRDTAMLVMLYLNLASCYSSKQDTQKFGQCCEAILPLIGHVKNNRLLYGLYQDFGAYYMHIRKPALSLEYFNKAKEISVRDGNLNQLSYTYLGLSNLYEQIGRADSALFYMRRYKELDSKMVNNTKLLEAYRAYISAALESTQKELTIADQNLQLKNRTIVLIVGFAVGIILVFILLLIVVQQKKRIKDTENRDLEERLQSKQLLEQLQKERIEAQAREITSHAIMLSNKNQILQQISEEVNKIPKSKYETKAINQIIKSNLNYDQSWDNVIMHFEKVHPDFFNKLNALGNRLTENNLRLCAYLRIGIPLKQIAHMLNVSHGSIIIQRYRLKKKFGLTEEQDLDDFIRNI